MTGKRITIAAITAAMLLILISVLIAAAVEQAPLLVADGLGSVADAYFETLSQSSISRWLDQDYIYLSQYKETDYRYYYLALSVSFYFSDSHNSSIATNHNWDDYMACFNAESESAAFNSVLINYKYEITEEIQPFILGFASELRRMNNNDTASGGVCTVGEVTVDFGSKYYTFSANLLEGNPCVCDVKNNVAWPYNSCVALSYFHEFNKMICSSYAAGRYWEVNYPDDPFPLPLNWDSLITINHHSPGPGAFSTDISSPISRAIISIHHAGGNHDAFIENVDADGSVIVSECNASSERPYGFRVREFQSLQAFLDSYGSGTYLNGMYGK